MNHKKKLLICFLVSVISSCGGGGEGVSETNFMRPIQQGSSNWDAMVWDADNWG